MGKTHQISLSNFFDENKIEITNRIQMRVLHTSDWHLGRALYSKSDRSAEHAAFLDWLLKTIKIQAIDLLIVAGDVFDTNAPGTTSQKLYYNFLINVKKSGCQHVVITGGNHDSPGFLNAPKDVLAALNVYVVGNAGELIDDELITIKNEEGAPLAIVAAVPFLRERDISRFTVGESYNDRSKRVNECIKNHYHQIADLARQKRSEYGKIVPVIATGHLSVIGGKREQDDGVRETYIGNVEAVGADIFPNVFDYVALGHIHVPSKIKDHIRYCGSPIPMGFGEAGQTKCVYVVDFNEERKIETIEIPVFQSIESIKGSRDQIQNRLTELRSSGSSVWVEIIYNGKEMVPDLSAWVKEQVKDSLIEVLKFQNLSLKQQVLTRNDTPKSLGEISDEDVFKRLMEKRSLTPADQQELLNSYNEIKFSLTNKD